MNAKYRLLMFVFGSLLCRPIVAQAPNEPSSAPAPAPTVSVQFPGGSLEDYVNTLRSAAPGFSVVVTVPESRDIKIPAIKLDSVSFAPAVRLLEGEYQLGDGNSVQLFISDLGGQLGDNHPARVYKIWRERQHIHRAPTQVRVWNIGGLIGSDRKAEDILTAVETAVGLLEGYADAKIRYHAETNLIVASGEEEQLRAIDRVIVGLHESRKSPDERRSEAQTKESLRDLLESLSEGKAPPEALKHFGDLQQDLQDKDRTIAELRKQLAANKKE